MKKTVIAMAVAAALPVTSQADVTLSGSVEASYIVNSTRALDIDSDLDIAVKEVLSNGMTASASFDVGTEGDSGQASLEGDFGTLTVGSDLDKDGAFQSGVLVTGTVNELYETSDSASTANAIHYTGSWADLKIQAQVNAGTTATGSTTQSVTTLSGASNNTAATAVAATSTTGYYTDTVPSATQVAATYVFNGITLAAARVGADMTSKIAATDVTNGTIKEGRVFGATYSFGDLSVGYSDYSVANDPVMMIGYKATYGHVDVNASAYDWGNDTSTYGSASYTIDGLTVALDYDSDKGKDLSRAIQAGTKTSTVTATYVAGHMTVQVGTKFDGTTDYSLALDLGNADLSLERDDSKAKTTAKYSVAF
jgi:phage tail tube protein FII